MKKPTLIEYILVSVLGLFFIGPIIFIIFLATIEVWRILLGIN